MLGTVDPIGNGESQVLDCKKLEFKFDTRLVDPITKGAVPVTTVLVI